MNKQSEKRRKKREEADALSKGGSEEAEEGTGRRRKSGASLLSSSRHARCERGHERARGAAPQLWLKRVSQRVGPRAWTALWVVRTTAGGHPPAL